MIYLLLFLFFLKHFLADFLWQSERMLQDKGTFGALGGVQHAGLHGAFTYVILLHFVDPIFALGLALADAVLHYHIDWSKRQMTRSLTADEREYWIWFGVDQLLHAVTYFAIVYAVMIIMFTGVTTA